MTLTEITKLLARWGSLLTLAATILAFLARPNGRTLLKVTRAS